MFLIKIMNAMSNFISRPIGQTFQDGKVPLVVVASDSCKGCYYYLKQKCWSSRNQAGLCSENREDKEPVIFKKSSRNHP